MCFTRSNTIIQISKIASALDIKEGEVKKTTSTRKVRIEGVKQAVPTYSLDVIISVGYRVKSKNGVLFRKWATKTLKDYLIKGYAVNQKRLEYLEKTIKLIDIASRIDINSKLEDEDAKKILKVLGDYTKAFDLLDDYDHKTMKKIKGNKDKRQINYDNCKKIIRNMAFNDKNDLFAIERQEGLKSIIANIYQTFGGTDVYPSIEEKGANFLYLVVKNHVFIDGNKRIAAALFVYFLDFYNILIKNEKQIIDNNTLTALTLLIAESSAEEKDIIVDLVMNFLNN